MYGLGIETFLTVVRVQTLSKAAQELNVAQTTISKRLKLLEQETGLNLIERSKGVKQIRLTPAGEEFYNLAERWNLIAREARILQTQGPKLSLVVGSVDSLNTFLLPQVYQAILGHTPRIKLEIRTLHSIELYTEVEKRQVDVAFVLRELVHSNVNVAKCFTSPMVVLRLATGDGSVSETLHPADLDSNYELFLPWGQQYQIWHDRWWDPLSLLHTKLDNTNLLLTLIKDPRQWAIVPMWIARAVMNRGNYSIGKLSDPPPSYTCYKLTHKHPTSQISQCLEIINQYLELTIPG